MGSGTATPGSALGPRPPDVPPSQPRALPASRLSPDIPGGSQVPAAAPRRPSLVCPDRLARVLRAGASRADRRRRYQARRGSPSRVRPKRPLTPSLEPRSTTPALAHRDSVTCAGSMWGGAEVGRGWGGRPRGGKSVEVRFGTEREL